MRLGENREEEREESGGREGLGGGTETGGKVHLVLSMNIS